jgi:hypothetical protein
MRSSIGKWKMDKKCKSNRAPECKGWRTEIQKSVQFG